MKSTLFSDIKKFVKCIQRKSYIIQMITLVLFLIFVVYQVNENNKIMNQIKKAEKKVDFRYFNLTESIKEIHGVNIDTQNGHVIRLIVKQ